MGSSESRSNSRDVYNHPYLFPKLHVNNPELYGKTRAQSTLGKLTLLASENEIKVATLMELGSDDEHDPITTADGKKRQRLYPQDSSVYVLPYSKVSTNPNV
ncbi:hypothetical protein V6N12_050320 [Hibiscus sabdariffa]|uniref:Uncharacterized protein n=1 Tax=Hibiscus sabdariffa TaxID=183260 RepID=A0ABR2GD94_9ROSI